MKGETHFKVWMCKKIWKEHKMLTNFIIAWRCNKLVSYGHGSTLVYGHRVKVYGFDGCIGGCLPTILATTKIWNKVCRWLNIHKGCPLSIEEGVSMAFRNGFQKCYHPLPLTYKYIYLCLPWKTMQHWQRKNFWHEFITQVECNTIHWVNLSWPYLGCMIVSWQEQ
jgi:hypothetical protein